MSLSRRVTLVALSWVRVGLGFVKKVAEKFVNFQDNLSQFLKVSL